MPAWLLGLLSALLRPVVEQIVKDLGLYFDNKKIDAQDTATTQALSESQKAVTEDERKKAIHDIASGINQ